MSDSDMKVKKVVVSMGVGQGAQDKGEIEKASQDLLAITGQKPKVTQAKISISEFKLRKGAPIGLMATLRGRRKDDFLKKLFRIALPRLRDFRGLPAKSFDGRGNYNLGIPEQIVFPEVDASKVNKVRGLQVTIVTNAGSDKKAQEFLENLGMPFEK